MKIISILSLLILLTGCGMTRTLNYPYTEVAEVLKNKFAKSDDDFKSKKTLISDSDNAMELLLDIKFDFYYAIIADIDLKAKGSHSSVITLTITENFKSWSYKSRNKKLEKKFMAVLEKRLKTGKWDAMPWTDKENRSSSIFSAMFTNVGE
jgi:hypothetical protein